MKIGTIAKGGFGKFNIGSIFAPRVPYIVRVIKKGEGIGPVEALATLCHREGATFYH